MKTALLLLLASCAIASPILVTGSGTFNFNSSQGMSMWTVSFGGTGVNVTGFSSPNGQGGSPLDGSIWGSVNGFGPMGAGIDGQGYRVGFFSFALGGPNGSIMGYDSAHNPVVTEAIEGYLSVTSEMCFGPSNQDCWGTFSVTAPVLLFTAESFAVAVPEPSSLVLVLAGIAAGALLFAGWVSWVAYDNSETAKRDRREAK